MLPWSGWHCSHASSNTSYRIADQSIHVQQITGSIDTIEALFSRNTNL